MIHFSSGLIMAVLQLVSEHSKHSAWVPEHFPSSSVDRSDKHPFLARLSVGINK
jgi:hypothetical protein